MGMLGGEEVEDDSINAKQQMAGSCGELVTPKKSRDDADGSDISQRSQMNDAAITSIDALTSNADQPTTARKRK